MCDTRARLPTFCPTSWRPMRRADASSWPSAVRPSGPSPRALMARYLRLTAPVRSVLICGRPRARAPVGGTWSQSPGAESSHL